MTLRYSVSSCNTLILSANRCSILQYFLNMVSLSPIVRLDFRDTFEVFRAFPVGLVVVRLQDVVSKNTYKFNKTYYDVISAGGLHDFLDFRGHILLSLIMRDELIANFGPENYAEVLNSLTPDYFTTVDGETYEGARDVEHKK